MTESLYRKRRTPNLSLWWSPRTCVQVRFVDGIISEEVEDVTDLWVVFLDGKMHAAYEDRQWADHVAEGLFEKFDKMREESA